MKVALIVEPGWLEREFEMHRHLVVGLVGEGVGVVRVAPEGSFEDLATTLVGERVTYRPSRWDWLQDWRIRRMAEELEDQEAEILHAMSGAVYGPAVALGKALDRPVVCSLWSADQAKKISGARSERAPVLTLPTEPMYEACRTSADDPTVRLVRPGVMMPDDLPASMVRADDSLCVLVVGDGQTDGSYRPLLEALAEVRDDLPQVMFFLCTMNGDPHRLWQYANELKLLGHVNLVEPGPDANALMVQADVIIQPQVTGVYRSVVIEAMAAGRPVIARPDPMLDYLVDDVTARLVDGGDKAMWAAMLRDIAEDAAKWRALGRSAREYVRQRYRASRFIEEMLEVYRQAAEQPLAYLPRVAQGG